MSRLSPGHPYRTTLTIAALTLAASAAMATVASATIVRAGDARNSMSGGSRDVIHDRYGPKGSDDAECASAKVGKRAKAALTKRTAKYAKTGPHHRDDECDDARKVKPLKVVKTATTSYTRTFPWTITKSAAPTSPVTATADTTSFDYAVVATKGQAADSGFKVTGTITVSNPNSKVAKGVDITDSIADGTACVVDNGLNRTIPGASGHRESTYDSPREIPSITVSYTCEVDSSASGTNVAIVTWKDTMSTGTAPFAFGAPTTVVNETVDVLDAFNFGVPALLEGGDDIATTSTFRYSRSVTVPASACSTYDNTAKVISGGTVLAQASAQVEACRTSAGTPESRVLPTPPLTPVVTTGATTGATLRVAKRGPARAAAGQLVTYTIIVRNANPTATASTVVLTDILPAGYTITRRPTGASLRKGKLVWTLGDLAPGAAKALRVQVRIDRAVSGTRCNTAVASAANATTVRARACTQVARVAGVSRIPIVTG